MWQSSRDWPVNIKIVGLDNVPAKGPLLPKQRGVCNLCGLIRLARREGRNRGTVNKIICRDRGSECAGGGEKCNEFEFKRVDEHGDGKSVEWKGKFQQKWLPTPKADTANLRLAGSDYESIRIEVCVWKGVTLECCVRSQTNVLVKDAYFCVLEDWATCDGEPQCKQ